MLYAHCNECGLRLSEWFITNVPYSSKLFPKYRPRMRCLNCGTISEYIGHWDYRIFQKIMKRKTNTQQRLYAIKTST